MNSLDNLVFSFRKAIEEAKNNYELGLFFRRFPTGQCGCASDMLSQFLVDNGVRGIRYVNGTYYGKYEKEEQSHTWLVVNGLIVDITGDQFRDYAEPLSNDIPVYIGPMNEYYQLFDTTNGSNYEHFGLDDQWSNYHELKEWYNVIIKYI